MYTYACNTCMYMHMLCLCVCAHAFAGECDECTSRPWNGRQEILNWAKDDGIQVIQNVQLEGRNIWSEKADQQVTGSRFREDSRGGEWMGINYNIHSQKCCKGNYHYAN